MDDLTMSLPTLLVLVPAAGGLICMAMVTRRAAGIAALLTALVQTACIVLGVSSLRDGVPDGLALNQSVEWFAPWNIHYAVELNAGALGLIALTTLVTLCASMFAWHAGRERPAPFQGLLWLSAASLCGLFVARDLVLFYVFFELMLVPLLFLVGSWGGSDRVRAAITMFVYTLIGSLLMLVGIIKVGLQAGSFDLEQLGQAGERYPWWVFATFVLAFAIKAPLVPLHGWLPLVYRQAPPEVTAVLSGLVSKAAMFGFLIVVLPLFPDHMDSGWGMGLTFAAIFSLLYGSLAAFRQPDARGVVAYSSLAQMGLILLGASVYLGEGGDQAIAGAYMQAINHGLVSAGLFLLVGLIELRTQTVGVLARLGNLASGRPILASIGLVLALAALAVPGSNTFAGELLILAGVFQGPWEHSWVFAALGGTAIVLAAMYALRLLSALVHARSIEDPAAADADAFEAPMPAAGERGGADDAAAFGADLRWGELLIVMPLVAAILTLSVWPNTLRSAMKRSSAVPVKMDGALHDRHSKGKH